MVSGQPGDNGGEHGAFNIGISLGEIGKYLGLKKKRLMDLFIALFTGCTIDKKYLREFDRVLAIKISKFTSLL